MERALRNVSVRKKKYRSTVLQEVPHFLYFETDVRPLLEDSANQRKALISKLGK